MAAYKEVEVVQAHGCGVIWGLAEGKVAQDAVGGHGGISAVLDAHHPHRITVSRALDECAERIGASSGDRHAAE